MRAGFRILVVSIIGICLLSGCRNAGKKAKPLDGVAAFWEGTVLLEDDISLSEDRFADFAQLAVEAPEDEAFAALDRLFDRLKAEDEVAYYVYSGWIDGAFYNLLSPCHNAKLYTHAVDRIVSDGVLTEDECTPFIRRRNWVQYNQAGEPATVPGITVSERTLVLVLDQSCPSCHEALTSLAQNSEWAETRRVAFCCGYGPVPTVPGWEYVAGDNSVFDPKMTPIFFVVAADGSVETPYQLAL